MRFEGMLSQSDSHMIICHELYLLQGKGVGRSSATNVYNLMQLDTADRSLRIRQRTGIALAGLLAYCSNGDQKLSTTLIWFLFSRLYIQDLTSNLQICFTSGTSRLFQTPIQRIDNKPYSVVPETSSNL
jgi:hypothetical protein